MRIRRTTSLQMESRARKPIKKQLSAVSVSRVIFLLRSVTFPTEILLQVSAVIIKRRLYTHESKLQEFFLFSSIISMRQRIVSVFSSIFLSISWLLRPGTKRRIKSFSVFIWLPVPQGKECFSVSQQVTIPKSQQIKQPIEFAVIGLVKAIMESEIIIVSQDVNSVGVLDLGNPHLRGGSLRVPNVCSIAHQSNCVTCVALEIHTHSHCL